MVPIEEYERRITSVLQVMEREGVDCLLLNRTNSIKYLTGASNTCSWVFLTRSGRRIALVLESDYLDYKSQSILTDIRTHRPHDPVTHFAKLPKELGLKDGSMVVETDHLRVNQYLMLEKFFGSVLRKDLCADTIVQEARMVKTPEEIECVRKAAQLGMLGMKVAKEGIARGLTEVELARRVVDAMVAEGADDNPLLYVATDGRSSLAHNMPTRKKIEKGPVVLDIHVAYRGYHADIARTYFLEDPGNEQQEAYSHFKEVVLRGIKTVKAGTTLVDARRFFHQSLQLREDWIPLFGPVLHGVGIMNRELPKFGHPWEGPGTPPRPLEANLTMAWGNVGLYSMKGWGIRYEDTFLVTESDPVLFSVGD